MFSLSFVLRSNKVIVDWIVFFVKSLIISFVLLTGRHFHYLNDETCSLGIRPHCPLDFTVEVLALGRGVTPSLN